MPSPVRVLRELGVGQPLAVKNGLKQACRPTAVVLPLVEPEHPLRTTGVKVRAIGATSFVLKSPVSQSLVLRD